MSISSSYSLRENEIIADGSVISVFPSTNNYPALSNIVVAPLNAIWCIKQIIYSSIIKDNEGLKESIGQLTSSFAAFCHAMNYSLCLIYEFMTKSVIATGFNHALSTLAFVLCGIEFMLESIRLVKQLLFQNQLFKEKDGPRLQEETKEGIHQFLEQAEQFLEKLTIKEFSTFKAKLLNEIKQLKIDDQAPFSQAKTLEKKLTSALYLYNIAIIDTNYFKINEKEKKAISQISSLESKHLVPKGFESKRQDNILDGKAIQLTRRIQPWLFTEYQVTSAAVTHRLENCIMQDGSIDLEAIEEAKNLFEKIDTQSKKTIQIHLVAIFALGLSIASVVCTLIAAPFALPLAFGITAGVFSFTAGTLKTTLLPSEGYTFNWQYMLPDFLRKKLEA
jgi:hypothetical protein